MKQSRKEGGILAVGGQACFLKQNNTYYQNRSAT